MCICLSVNGCWKSEYKVWRAEGGTYPKQVNAIMENDYIIFEQEYFDEVMGVK